MKNESTSLKDKLNKLEQRPPEAAWAAIEASLNNKKKKPFAWFPMVAAAVLLGLVGLSAMIYLETSTTKGISPELEQQLLPQGLEQGPIEKQETTTPTPTEEPKEVTLTETEPVSKQDAIAPSKTEKQAKETAKPEAIITKRVIQKDVDPFVQNVGSAAINTDITPATKTIRVDLSKMEEPVEEAEPTVTEELKGLLAKIKPAQTEPSKAIKKIKELKNPENWNLPQVEVRLPRVFDNLKPKTEEK